MEVHVQKLSPIHHPHKARKRRVVRGVVATYLRELSTAAHPKAVVAPEPAKA
jgi:hypothetical protein